MDKKGCAETETGPTFVPAKPALLRRHTVAIADVSHYIPLIASHFCFSP